MKKATGILWAFLLIGILAAGCGKGGYDADSTGIYVTKSGEVYTVDVESFDEVGYDQDGVEAFVNARISDYNTRTGAGRIELVEIAETDGGAKLRMRFDSTSDYVAFRGIDLYQGSIVDAMSAGFDFKDDFVRVSKGAPQEKATRQDIMDAENVKVVITNGNIEVRVGGEIQFVSGGNVSFLAKDTVVISNEGQKADPQIGEKYTYIIYR